MESVIEIITPEKAREYLKRNCRNNRKIGERRVQNYAKDMAAGAWQLNGEAIKFNKDGILIDGQHRLLAVIKAGVPIKMLVIRDVDNTVSLYDRGYSRATYSSLLMSGVNKELANTITCGVAKLKLMMSKGRSYYSDNQIEQFLLDNADALITAKAIGCKYTVSKNKTARVCTNNVVFVTALFDAINAGESKKDLEKFCEIISTGFYDDKSQTSAVVCRNDLISRAIDIKTSSSTRILAVIQIKKAIYDFCHRIPRTKSYANWTKDIYEKGENV